MKVTLFIILSLISSSAFSFKNQTEIYGGERVKGEEYHSAVLLIANINGTKKPFCGGVLVKKDLILTAAHCLANNLLRPITEKVSVILGNEYISGKSNELTILEAKYHHDFFKSEEEINDIAYIILKNPAQIHTSNIPLVPQSVTETEELFHKESPATIVGFGKDQEGNRGIKNKATTTFIDKLNQTELIIGSNGKDSCDGDSGGPAYMTAQDGSLRVVGITSRGIDNTTCGEGGIYTNIFHYVDWIEHESGRTLTSVPQ